MREKVINTVTISLDEYLRLIEIKKATEVDGLVSFGWKMYSSNEAIKILNDEIVNMKSMYESKLQKCENIKFKLFGWKF